MFWDRRKKDRREKKDDTPGKDRREGGEKSDRRQWTCGILFKTSIPVFEIESWLDANADGSWKVALEGIGEELSSNVLKIMFEDQEDKSTFVEAFSRYRR